MGAINELAQPYRDKLKVALTETNAITFGNGWEETNDLGHALAVFDIFGANLELEKLESIHLWNTRWQDNDVHALVTDPVTGGPDLLTASDNPGFESNLSGWSAPAGASVTTDSHSGTKAFKADGTSSVYSERSIPTSLFQSGDIFQVAAWGKRTNGSAWSGIGIDFFNNGTKVLSRSVEVSSSNYRLAAESFIVPPNFNSVVIWSFTSQGTTAFYDDFKVSKTALPPSGNDALDREGNQYAIGKALGLWGRFIKDSMVKVQGESTGVRAYATKSDDGAVSVAIINKNTSATPVTVVLENHNGLPVGNRWQLTGTAHTDVNPSLNMAGDVTLNSGSASFTAPGVSITILDFPSSLATQNPVGVHQIASKLNPNLVLDTVDGSKGSNVLLKTDTDAPSQFWDVGSWSSGQHRFDNDGYASRTLEIWANNANIYDASEKDWKKFILSDNLDGTFSIQCIHTQSGLPNDGYLTATSGSNNANVTGALQNNSDSQKWIFIAPGGSPSTGTIYYSEDFEDGETFSDMSSTTISGNAVGVISVQTSGAIVPKDVPNPSIPITATGQLDLHMDLILPAAEQGNVQAYMIIKFNTTSGQTNISATPMDLLDQPGVVQSYDASITLPAGVTEILDVRIRVPGSGAGSQDLRVDNITISTN